VDKTDSLTDLLEIDLPDEIQDNEEAGDAASVRLVGSREIVSFESLSVVFVLIAPC
jgi:hypothetical protein